MPLVSLNPLLSRAREGRYAVLSQSVATPSMALGAVEAAESLKAPLILQVAEKRLDPIPLKLLAGFLIPLASASKIPVCVQLDHGVSLPCIYEAISLGFPSVMLDASDKPLAENIRLTRELAAYAHERGVTVETELGRFGKSEEGTEGELNHAREEDCLQMDALAGPDALAAAIGNAHGHYATKPSLQFDLLERLSRLIKAPLVLHGGTGLSDEDFTRLISLGITKINIATEGFDRALQARQGPSQDLFMNLKAERDAVKAVSSRYIRLFGSEGKAYEL